MSISDTSRLDANLHSMRFDESTERKNDGVHVQELNGVFLKRVPLVEADFDNNTTIPSYQYHIENRRDYDVRILMTFAGTNFKVSAAGGDFSKPSHESVLGVVAQGQSTTFAILEAADKTRDFTFSADIKVYPVQADVRETELEGVKLFTTIAYVGLTTSMVFEAKNNKEFDVEIELDLKGDVREASGPLPFKKVCRVGEKVFVGSIKSETEIESAWKWVGLSADAVNPQKPHVQTSELKGVTLKQTLTPGNPTMIHFEAVNGRERKVRVEVELSGDGEIDFRGHARPLNGSVLPGHTTSLGTIAIRGDAEVNWKFKEELN